MKDPIWHFAGMRELIDERKPSPEREQALTKLAECEMWLAKCEPSEEALQCP